MTSFIKGISTSQPTRAPQACQSGKKRVAEGFDSRTGSVIDGHGNRDPPDIVDGDGADNGDCHADLCRAETKVAESSGKL